MVNAQEKPRLSAWQMFLCAYEKLDVTRAKYPLLFLVLLAQIGADVATPYFYKTMIDGISNAIALKTAPELAFWGFVSLSLLWVCIEIVSIVASWFYGYSINKYVHKDWVNYLIHLSTNFLALPLSYHIGENTAEKTKIINRGSDAVFDVAYHIYRTILPQAIIFIGLLTVGFFTNTLMMLVILLLIPIGGGVSYWIGSKAYQQQKDSGKNWDLAYGRLGDAFINIAIVKLFSREAEEQARLQKLYEEAIEKQQKVSVLWNGFSAFLGGFNMLGKIGTMSLGMVLVLYGKLTIGEMFMFTIIAGQLFGPLGQLFGSYQTIIKASASYNKAQEILDMEKEVVNEGVEFREIKNSLCFEDVSFAYPKNDREVLKNISFEIKKGQKVAFIGHTGAGKTTLVQLLMRFYAPTSGKITVDGVNIADTSLKSYRSKLATVFQDTTLFNDTIISNLRYVDDSLTQEQIEEACKKAQIYDFIVGLKDGFETVVGERGLKLSGGEKQRIAIARAILSNPQILILDEATSALDTQTEKSVQKAFSELMEGRTSFIIAHRLSTILSADTIFLLENGEIVAAGNHTELYAKSPLYREMVDGQRVV